MILVGRGCAMLTRRRGVYAVIKSPWERGTEASIPMPLPGSGRVVHGPVGLLIPFRAFGSWKGRSPKHSLAIWGVVKIDMPRLELNVMLV
jgi:hypothetical protein